MEGGKVEAQRHLNRVADAEDCIRRLGAEEPPRSAGLAEKVAANLCSLFMFFEKLGAISRFALAQNCQVVRAIQSQVIVKEGDVGDAFYIIMTGRCVVYKAGQKAVRSGDTTKIIPFESEEGLGTRSYNFLADEVRSQRRFGGIITPLLMGDTFGEKALFQSDSAARKRARRRAASVVASVDSYLLKVSADEFLASIAHDHSKKADDGEDGKEESSRIDAGALLYAEQRCRNILSRPPSERRPDDVQLLCDFVSSVPFFQQLTASLSTKIASIMTMQKFEPGHVVFLEGHVGHAFFIIHTGSVRVQRKDGSLLSVLVAGDSFGEMALLSSTKGGGLRTASVVVSPESSCELIRIGKEDYMRILAPVMKSNFGAVGLLAPNMESARRILLKSGSRRSAEERGSLLHFLSQLPFFKQLPSWLNKRLTAEINLRMLRKGDVVCYQGDEGSEFFVILTGSVSVHVLKDNVKLALLRARKDWDGGSTGGHDPLGSEWGATVATLFPGDSLGQESLITGCPRAATVRCREPVELIVLHAKAYRAIGMLDVVYDPAHCISCLQRLPQERSGVDIERVSTFLRRIPFFKQLENAIVGKLAGVAKLADGAARSIMLVQGTKISDEVGKGCFYILLKGSVAIHILRSAASPDPHALHMLLSHRPRDLDEHKQAFLKLLEDDNEHPSNGHSREKQGQGQTAHRGRLIPFARFAERKNVLGPCVALLGPGDSLGELSLMNDATNNNATRSASAVCMEDCEFLVIQRDDFLHLLGDKKISYNPARARAVLCSPPEERSVGDVNLLLKLVDAIPFFAQIPIGAVKRMCTAMTYESLDAGEVLFRQGDEGDSFYIVLSGRLQVNVVDEEVMVKKKGGQVRAALVSSGDRDSYGTCVGFLSSSDSFGERSILSGERRAATIVCEQQAELMRLPRDAFDNIFSSLSEEIDYNPSATIEMIVRARRSGQTLKGKNTRLLKNVMRILPQIPSSDIPKLIADPDVELKHFLGGEHVVNVKQSYHNVLILLGGKVIVSMADAATATRSIIISQCGHVETASSDECFPDFGMEDALHREKDAQSRV
eukprot:g2619.t1